MRVPAHACSCAPLPAPQEAKEKARAVFSGEVIKIEPWYVGKKVTVKVDRVWKGEVTETTAVITYSDLACCGYSFKEKNSYLIYTHKSENAEHNGVSDGVNSCSRTKELSKASEDLKALGEGEAPKKNKN